LEGKVGSGGTCVVESLSQNSSEQPPSIERFDRYTLECLDPFVAVCSKLGGDAFLVGTVIKEAWSEMRKILVLASNCKEPPQAGLPALLAGVSSKIKECSKLINRNEWEKHTKTCSEGISSLNWY
jgi:adenylyl cyclase-associated protein